MSVPPPRRPRPPIRPARVRRAVAIGVTAATLVAVLCKAWPLGV